MNCHVDHIPFQGTTTEIIIELHALIGPTQISVSGDGRLSLDAANTHQTSPRSPCLSTNEYMCLSMLKALVLTADNATDSAPSLRQHAAARAKD